MLYAAAAAGQTTLPTRADRPIADKSMVITDRGQKLEVYPTFRAKPELSGSHVRYRVSSTDADSPVGSTNMAVAFNHTMLTECFLTGEIAFQMKDGAALSGLDPADYPNLVKVANHYDITAGTPAESVKLFNRLKARTDLAWVQVVVRYGSVTGATRGRN